MKPLHLLAPLLLIAAGCATSSRGDFPVRNVRYSAAGENPTWMLAIGAEGIAFRQAGEVWKIAPRTSPRVRQGVRTWRSGHVPGAIVVEARAAPCTSASGEVFEDEVVVRLSDDEINLEDGSIRPFTQQFRGCGGARR